MYNDLLARIKRSQAHNLYTIRTQPLAELSGSLGDLGTLLPLLIALTLTKSISLPSTLVFTGLANIATGLVFGLPLPVQPMKAIAAVAISREFNIRETAAAGITVSAIVLVLSITGLLSWFSRVIPIPVVKGIQVGAGLSLILSAGTSLLSQLGWTAPSWKDNLLWALFAFIFLLATTVLSTHARINIPYALLVFTLGLIFAASTMSRHEGRSRHLWQPELYIPSVHQFGTTLSASLGQLPLTTLNSIIAVSHLSSDLLPSIPEPSPTALGLSVATMNLVSCWFGGMPACHGSGGLAGQYRFGARSGASVIVLGTVKLLLGLFVSDALVGLLAGFPKALLGIMVIAAGVELAKVGESLNDGARDLWETSNSNGQEGDESAVTKRQRLLSEEERRERWSVMLVTVAGLLAFKNDAVGFLAGMIWHWGLRSPAYLERLRRSGTTIAEEEQGLLYGSYGYERPGNEEHP